MVDKKSVFKAIQKDKIQNRLELEQLKNFHINRAVVIEAPAEVQASPINAIKEDSDEELLVNELYGTEDELEILYGRYNAPFDNDYIKHAKLRKN